jgi:structure-specific recognition protein 1
MPNRGRYDIDMFGSFLRLHGQTYDYKVRYQSIQQLYKLPRVDLPQDILLVSAAADCPSPLCCSFHSLETRKCSIIDFDLLFFILILQVQLDQPVRQGATTYPYLILTFPRDKQITADIAMDE